MPEFKNNEIEISRNEIPFLIELIKLRKNDVFVTRVENIDIEQFTSDELIFLKNLKNCTNNIDTIAYLKKLTQMTHDHTIFMQLVQGASFEKMTARKYHIFITF